MDGDLLGYETQLRCGKLELEAAKNALEKAELNLNDKIEQLIEVDIEKSTLLLKSLELKEDSCERSELLIWQVYQFELGCIKKCFRSG